MGSPQPGHPEVLLYVPRAATEKALEQLSGFLEAGRWCVSLLGPRRCGKSLLLGVLATRLSERFHCVSTTARELAGNEVAALVLDRFGMGTGDTDARLARLGEELRQRKQAIILLIDDAHELDPGVQRSLAGGLSRCKGGLRAVLAGPDRSSLVTIGRTLEPSNECVWLREPVPALRRVMARPAQDLNFSEIETRERARE